MFNKLLTFGLLFTIYSFSLSGCSTLEKNTASRIAVDAGSMTRNSFTILKPVEGTSTRVSILLGLYQKVDGNKIRLLWIPFYRDQFAHVQPPSFWEGTSSEDRAYFQAISQVPEADDIVSTSYVKEQFLIPLLYKEERVTFRGKAVRIKSDGELN